MENFREYVLNEIRLERERQITLKLGGDTDDFDRTNSQNDWIAYIAAYSGRAAQKVEKNDRQLENYYENMVKVGALVVAALEAYHRSLPKWD